MIALTLLLTQSLILKKGIPSVLSGPGWPVDFMQVPCSAPILFTGAWGEILGTQYGLLSLTRYGQSVSQFPTSVHHKTCTAKDVSEYVDRNIES